MAMATLPLVASSVYLPTYYASKSGKPSTAILTGTNFRQSFRSSVTKCADADKNRRRVIEAMAPDDEKMTRRSPLDFPVEWDRPSPGRRPDIFPQFSPMKTPLPPPLPTDPPEEDEEEEEKKEEEPEKEPEKPEE